jgi:hypothetical protein
MALSISRGLWIGGRSVAFRGGRCGSMLVHSASERSVRYALLMLGRMPTSKEPISGPPKDLLKISLSRHAESKAKASKQTRTLSHPLEAYRLCIGSQQGAEAQLKLDGALGMTCPPRSPQHWEVISVIGSMGNSRMNADQRRYSWLG